MKFEKGWNPFKATNNESFETFFSGHLSSIIIIYQYNNTGYTKIPKTGGNFSKNHNYWILASREFVIDLLQVSEDQLLRPTVTIASSDISNNGYTNSSINLVFTLSRAVDFSNNDIIPSNGTISDLSGSGT